MNFFGKIQSKTRSSNRRNSCSSQTHNPSCSYLTSRFSQDLYDSTPLKLYISLFSLFIFNLNRCGIFNLGFACCFKQQTIKKWLLLACERPVFKVY